MRLPREWPDDIVGSARFRTAFFHIAFRSCWRCRPVSSRLVRILQIRAFPFRHCTEFGSPSQNRTEVGRVRAGRFATKLRGGSCFAFGWQLVSLRCSAHRSRASKARTLLHELQAVFRSAALPWERRRYRDRAKLAITAGAALSKPTTSSMPPSARPPRTACRMRRRGHRRKKSKRSCDDRGCRFEG